MPCTDPDRRSFHGSPLARTGYPLRRCWMSAAGGDGNGGLKRLSPAYAGMILALAGREVPMPANAPTTELSPVGRSTR